MKTDNIIQGISLRDQFAIAALPAIIADAPRIQEYPYDRIARDVYAIADAMVKEHDKGRASRYGKKRQE